MKKIAIAVAVMLLGSSGAWALSLTTANTDVNNSVTLNYKVGGTSQTAIEAHDTGFVVDRKVDLTVSNDDPSHTVNVAPGNTDRILHFTVKNTGNDQEIYALSIVQHGHGLADNFDPTSCTIEDNASNSGATLNITIPQEDQMSITVHCNIPSTAGDDDNGTIDLLASVTGRTKANDDADDPAAVQDIFADAAGVAGTATAADSTDIAYDAKHSAYGIYHVKMAKLAVNKESCVITDPVGGATHPHAIPGATIRYAITIVNSGTGDANNTVLTDDINVTVFDDTKVANLKIDTGACDCSTGGSSAAGGTSGFSTPTVTLDFEDVAAGDTECGYFEVKIK
jgi:uncharacterized repeat protein (TIGR01451 family)